MCIQTGGCTGRNRSAQIKPLHAIINQTRERIFLPGRSLSLIPASEIRPAISILCAIAKKKAEAIRGISSYLERKSNICVANVY